MSAAETTSSTQAKDQFSVNDLVQLCLRKWPWFVLSMVVCLGLGFLYIKCQEPVYERSDEILIKDQEAGGGIGGMSSAFASMGLVSGKTNVFNELISISSPAILAEVINQLHLDVNYVEKGFFHGTDLYGDNLPFEVKFLDLDDKQSAEFHCEVSPDGTMRLFDFVSYSPSGEKIRHEEEIPRVKIGSIVKTPVGKIQFIANVAYLPVITEEKEDKSKEITIAKLDIQSAIECYQGKIQSDIKDEYADVIIMTMRDVNVQRAVDVLNMILTVYNENWVEDKNKIAKATSAFIEDRLRIIEKELGVVDSNIAQYKSETEAMSLSQKGAVLMAKGEELENKIISLNNNLALCRYMLDYLKDSSNKYNIIPNNTGAQSPEVEAQIHAYNEMLLNRNTLESNSSSTNPLVKDYDNQLANMRSAILKGMANQIMQLENLLASAKREQVKAHSSLKSTPIQTLPLLSEQRQQTVKEEF